MRLKEFINEFVAHNTLIRLMYKVPKNERGMHNQVMPGEGVMMEHELIKSEYADKEVIGITDILVIDSNYKEAVNIIIKK